MRRGSVGRGPLPPVTPRHPPAAQPPWQAGSCPGCGFPPVRMHPQCQVPRCQSGTALGGGDTRHSAFGAEVSPYLRAYQLHTHVSWWRTAVIRHLRSKSTISLSRWEINRKRLIRTHGTMVLVVVLLNLDLCHYVI